MRVAYHGQCDALQAIWCNTSKLIVALRCMHACSLLSNTHGLSRNADFIDLYQNRLTIESPITQRTFETRFELDI